MRLSSKKSFSYAKYGYIFSIPFIIIYLIFHLYPTIYTAVLGFTDCKGLGNTNWHFLKQGEIWKNFDTILKNPSFKVSLKNTLKIWTMNFIPQITLALLLSAWFTSRRNKIRGQGFFKVVFYMPNIITAATVAVLFAQLFGYPRGPANDLLTKGISIGSWQIIKPALEKAHNFTVDKAGSQYIVAFIQFWQWYGYTMIILISGILGINPEIFEAAEIDGASDAQIFFRVTLPNLRTILIYTLITSMIGGLNMYDIPKLYLNGGPDNATTTTNVFIWKQAFSGSYLYARAAAASMIMFAIIAVCSVFVFFLMRERKGESHT